jgi:hypothetical protein
MSRSLVSGRKMSAITKLIAATTIGYHRPEDGGSAAVLRGFDYAAALASIGFQMLLRRVSGIRNRASTKHTAGTAIG